MSAPRARGGFTLIELLMVITVLAVLMAVLYPKIFSFQRDAEVRETKTLILGLRGAIMEYLSEKGDYPTDRISELDPKYRLSSNRLNEGIEALVVALALMGTPGALNLLEDLDAHGGLGNTDGDQAGAVLGSLGHRDQREILDKWGNPLAYFHHRNYGQAQQVTMKDGETQNAAAVKDPRSGGFMMLRSFQLISAGPDETFGTQDDVANFDLPKNG